MIDTIAGWSALFLLGALHGVNPGMGWLFAVGLGIQQGDGRAVWQSLGPLMIGHLLAVATALLAGAAIGAVIDSSIMRLLVAAALVAMGIYHLRRHRHPRYGGMRVTSRDLVVWSFLVATTHGAGLMAIPFVPSARDGAAFASIVTTGHAAHAAISPEFAAGGPSPAAAGEPAETATPVALVFATLVHTLAYLLSTGLIAAVVYYRFGVAFVRRAWLNVDLVWAGGLILTAIFVTIS